VLVETGADVAGELVLRVRLLRRLALAVAIGALVIGGETGVDDANAGPDVDRGGFVDIEDSADEVCGGGADELMA